MPAILDRLSALETHPLYVRLRRFRMPRFGAGTPRIVGIATVAVLLMVFGLFALFSRPGVNPVSTVMPAPDTGDRPGAAPNAYMARLAHDKALADAERAHASDKTYAQDMRVAQPDQPTTPTSPATTPAPEASVVPRLRFGEGQNTQAPVTQTPHNTQNQGDKTNPYNAQLAALLATWAPKAPKADLGIEGGGPNVPARETRSAGDAQPVSLGGRFNPHGQAEVPAPGATSPVGRDGRILMPALRWVSARVVMGTDSDTQGPVIVEMTSGPLAHDRLSGSATRKEDRLYVTMDQLSVDGGRRAVPVKAVLMVPETHETAVASDVDHHYLPRIVLPTLAATLGGLGQAVALSGSSFGGGPFGGYASYNQFNPLQLAGIAAGAGANTAGQLIQQAAPKQTTVTLAAGDSVGVMFLEPVVDGP